MAAWRRGGGRTDNARGRHGHCSIFCGLLCGIPLCMGRARLSSGALCAACRWALRCSPECGAFCGGAREKGAQECTEREKKRERVRPRGLARTGRDVFAPGHTETKAAATPTPGTTACSGGTQIPSIPTSAQYSGIMSISVSGPCGSVCAALVRMRLRCNRYLCHRTRRRCYTFDTLSHDSSCRGGGMLYLANVQRKLRRRSCRRECCEEVTSPRGR